MAMIFERVVSGVTDRKLILENDHAVRTMDIGSNWETVRLGVRFCSSGNGGTITTPELAIGVCNGTGNAYGSPTASDRDWETVFYRLHR